MRFTIVATIFTFAAAAYAAALDVRDMNSEDRDLVARKIEEGDIISSMLPDGRNKIDVYEDGVYQGYILEHNDEVHAYDSYGNEVDIEDLDEDLDAEDISALDRRSRWKVVLKLGKLIKKYGGRVLRYAKCVGYSAMLHCGDEYLDCAKMGIPPWGLCIEGHYCIGSKAKQCA